MLCRVQGTGVALSIVLIYGARGTGYGVQGTHDGEDAGASGCSNACPTARNGVCEDGSAAVALPDPRRVWRHIVCDYGTDCDDCGGRPVRLLAPARLEAMMPGAGPGARPPTSAVKTSAVKTSAVKTGVALLRQSKVDVNLALTLTLTLTLTLNLTLALTLNLTLALTLTLILTPTPTLTRSPGGAACDRLDGGEHDAGLCRRAHAER